MTDIEVLGAEFSVLIDIKLNGKQTNGLLDSGAVSSVIDIWTVYELRLEKSMKSKDSRVYGISREPVHVVGEFELSVDLGDEQVLEHTFEVVNIAGTTCILGRDLLRKLGSTEFEWQTQHVRLGTTWKNSHATIEGGEPITRASVAVLEDTEELRVASRDIINPNLMPHQKAAISRLLETFECVFAQNPKRPQPAKGVTHRIDIGLASPNKQRPIPITPVVETEIAGIVGEMLQNEICRPSNSPWASRVLLVTKRDGSQPFVVDYRQLTAVTRIDSYPMPNAEDILDRMCTHSYFSFVDGASAYWSIEVEASDRSKPAFVTQRGLYELNRMPFGLVNSQASYQRPIDETPKHVKRADPFVDYTCIHSESFEQHLTDLEKTFNALESANIQLRKDKCSFGNPCGEFLGHIVSHEGHSPIPRLMNKIRKAQRPSSRRQLQRFLGLANFYRKYIPKFATVAEPYMH